MIKRYIFTILRGIGYGIGFALISFLFNSCEVNAQEITINCSSGTCSRFNGTNITSKLAEDTYANLPVFMARGLSYDSNTSYAWFNLVSEYTSFDYSKIYDVNFSVVGPGIISYIDLIRVNNINCSFNKSTTGVVLGVNCPNVPGKYSGLNIFRVDIVFDIPETISGVNVPFGFSNTWSFVPTTSSLQEETNNKLNDVNDSITNSEVDNSNANSFFNNFESNDFGISGIISAPLTLIQQFNNNTCTPLKLSIKGKSIDLPCGQDFFNRSDMTEFVTIYNVIMGGLIAYGACIGIYKKVNDFKNPDNSKVEVLDL